MDRSLLINDRQVPSSLKLPPLASLQVTILLFSLTPLPSILNQLTEKIINCHKRLRIPSYLDASCRPVSRMLCLLYRLEYDVQKSFHDKWTLFICPEIRPAPLISHSIEMHTSEPELQKATQISDGKAIYEAQFAVKVSFPIPRELMRRVSPVLKLLSSIPPTGQQTHAFFCSLRILSLNCGRSVASTIFCSNAPRTIHSYTTRSHQWFCCPFVMLCGHHHRPSRRERIHG